MFMYYNKIKEKKTKKFINNRKKLKNKNKKNILYLLLR